jgi:hypothetical protein
MLNRIMVILAVAGLLLIIAALGYIVGGTGYIMGGGVEVAWPLVW